ncbi:MAG TPA: SPASM domain-containing protein, partial [bacterium]|nr:SPASM domain-containing protein [bacterium]
KLVQAPVELAVSVDGTTKEVYEKIRSGSDFNRLKKNLARLKKLRKKPSPMSLRLHTVVMRSNLDQMTDFAAFAEEFGFDALHFMPLYGNEEPGEDLFRHGEDLPEIESIRIRLKKVSQKAKEAGIEFLNSLPVSLEVRDSSFCPGRPEKKEEELLCTLPWQQMNLDPGGEVRPGCLCTLPVGRVPGMSLLEIWNSPAMQKYREALLGKENSLCFRNCIEGRVPAELRKV